MMISTDNGDNNSSRQRRDAGLQSFTLVKYFSFFALGAILIFTMILSWIML